MRKNLIKNGRNILENGDTSEKQEVRKSSFKGINREKSCFSCRTSYQWTELKKWEWSSALLTEWWLLGIKTKPT
ncbi:hypothetical protein CEXT_442231 [Caerostris extrusa]|uniref:Uncharacterized protein n=1 Tax=Caerostris extrusa TaxID=172846 RepID=A0AAV4S5R1_CAEEX|nr:hypothetical protein CEXT_442231 [Caerostris extrusa]